MNIARQTTAWSVPASAPSPARLWQLAVVAGRPVLRLGQRSLPLDEVRDYHVQRIAERDNEGLLFNFALFGLLACALVIPVLQNVLAVKFLIAASVLGAIALMSLSEVLFAQKIEYFRLDFELLDGRIESFVSGNSADIEAVTRTMAWLGAAPVH